MRIALQVFLLTALSGSLCAALPVPEKDVGPLEYRSNAGPVLGEAESPYSPGALWVVVTAKLEGRSNPTSTAPVVRVFGRGAVLQAEVGRGGSDESLLNFIDEQGHAWLAVRVPGLPDFGCYVRANRHTLVQAQP